MSISDYLNTAGGIIWTVVCIPLGIFLSWLAVQVINRVPAKWLCDYGEEPSEELLSGKRVSFQKEGIITAVIFCIGLVMCRLQFNKGFDVYFITFALIIFFAVLMAVCDIKYMIIPDQFTIAVGILSAVVSTYDIIRGFKILHPEWWMPLLGIAIGGGTMMIIDLIGMLVYKKNGMGFGDVKLFAAVGVLTGFPGTVYTFIISLLTATVCFAVIISLSEIRSNQNKAETEMQTENKAETEIETENEGTAEKDVSAGSYLAFGPYIAAALIGYIVFFDTIYYLANIYLELF